MSKYILVLLLAISVFVLGCTGSDSHTHTHTTTDSTNGSLDTGSQPNEVPETDNPESSLSLTSSYNRYTKAAFEKAKADGNVIFVEFHADWCPTCIAQKPVNEKAFASSEMPKNAIGFEVHYNDSFTNDEDRRIARDFGVVYQHTQFVLGPTGNMGH